ncbi:MAG: hypothetical protein GF417_03835 [Candidatus Latescibacteria bacterium]|nr:hypothetical protein [Candidatus Latescibacterota bacterium]
MKRVKIQIWMLVTIVTSLVVMISLPGCRREKDPIDKNRAPETYLSVAPPETLGTNYRYHMYWYGEDKDGVIEQYIFYISDSVRTLYPEENRQAEILDWNPANRKADYISGRFTSRTDTIITFEGYDEQNELLRNRQAFHIAAVDDGGLIDETPARIQFFATAEGEPLVKYWVRIGDGEYSMYDPASLDTISMFIPLDIKFTGETVNGAITGYRWFYLGNTYPLDESGNVVWRIPETPFDTVFVNDIGQTDNLPSGDFFFRGVVRDEASALSGSDEEDLCHLVVNFDPDTRILYGDNFFVVEGQEFPDCTYVDFNDDIPDTLPYGSWIRISYTGWDDPRDILQFPPPDSIPIRFKYRLLTTGVSNEGTESVWQTPFFPAFDPEDTNPGKIDSATITVSSKKYDFRVRSYDEQDRYDHTPARVTFYGNFQPTVDFYQIGKFYITFNQFQLFTPLDGDTIYLADPMNKGNWNRAEPNYYSGDTLFPRTRISGFDTTGLDYFFYLKGRGYDDPRDKVSGEERAVYYWRYSIGKDGDDYAFGGEDQLFFADESNVSVNPDSFIQELRIRIPVDTDTGFPDPLIANDIKRFFGEQDITIIGYDMPRTEERTQKIRGESPKYDKSNIPWVLLEKGDLYESTQNVSNYARSDTLTAKTYIKPLW